MINPTTTTTTGITKHQVLGDSYDQMRETIRLIGQAIRNGAAYLPIRNHAAALASLAPPKDYLGQARNIFIDAIKRWRYVKDPVHRELVSFSPQALWKYVLAGDGVGVGRGRGAGDCDCISGAVGAQLYAIGLPVRLAITAPPHSPPGNLFAHIFVQANIPKRGWITVDPVVHPKHGFGYTPDHSRIAFFDLDGRLVGQQGNIAGLDQLGNNERGEKMSQYGGQIPDLTQWHDYGLGGDDYERRDPEDWRLYGLPNWGAFTEQLGFIDGSGLGIACDVKQELLGGRLLARTPILEMTPRDYKWMNVMRRPYHGMMALGDTGEIYEFDGSLGFFKRIWGGIKKVARRVGSGIKKVVSKIPGGKYLIKIGEKIMAVAKKFVRPLARFVGKYAAKLAPVAALIPGYGPAIAAGLYTAGKVANMFNKYDVMITGEKGKARGLKFKGGEKKAKLFQAALKKEAEKEKRRQAKGGKIKRIGEGKKKQKKGAAKKWKRKALKWKAMSKGGRPGSQMPLVSPVAPARPAGRRSMYAVPPQSRR